MDAKKLEQEWQVLCSLLPQGWDKWAYEEQVFRRRRGPIQSPELLLRLLLLHAGTGLSLRASSVRAAQAGLVDVSDVALLKRFRRCGRWVERMAQGLLPAEAQAVLLQQLQQPLTTRKVCVVDGSTVKEPGPSGQLWRVHYSVVLPTLACDQFVLSPASKGESLERFRIEPGTLVMADRGYARATPMAQARERGAELLVRLNSLHLPLEDPQGKEVDLLSLMRTLKGYEPSEWDVDFVAHGKRYRGRLCAVRISPEATRRAERRVERKAQQRNRAPKARTLELSHYIMTFTTVSAAELSCAQVLELYRMRWQVELCFKRLKSLLKLGHLPKRDEQSARAFFATKMLLALLIERMHQAARSFSPWGFGPLFPTAPQSVARDRACA